MTTTELDCLSKSMAKIADILTHTQLFCRYRRLIIVSPASLPMHSTVGIATPHFAVSQFRRFIRLRRTATVRN